jgi:hypothetical protein
MASGLHEFATSRLRRFETPDHRTFVTSRLRMFTASGLHEFATSRLRRFETLDHREFFVPENTFHEFHEPQIFLNSPTLAPRGNGLTPTVRFHENLRISVKKRHPRNIGGDTRHPETSQRSNRDAFAELPPLAPINRRLPLSKIFHRSLALLRTVVLTFAEKRLAF